MVVLPRGPRSVLFGGDPRVGGPDIGGAPLDLGFL
jgi:hypothetical protein